MDPGVRDALAADRIKQFESLFHMSPGEMDGNSAHEQAPKNLLGNTMDFDDEIEELVSVASNPNTERNTSKP